VTHVTIGILLWGSLNFLASFWLYGLLRELRAREKRIAADERETKEARRMLQDRVARLDRIQIAMLAAEADARRNGVAC